MIATAFVRLFVLFRQVQAKLFLFRRHGVLIITRTTKIECESERSAGFRFILVDVDRVCRFAQFVRWSESANLGKWAKIDLNDNAAGRCMAKTTKGKKKRGAEREKRKRSTGHQRVKDWGAGDSKLAGQRAGAVAEKGISKELEGAGAGEKRWDGNVGARRRIGQRVRRLVWGDIAYGILAPNSSFSMAAHRMENKMGSEWRSEGKQRGTRERRRAKRRRQQRKHSAVVKVVLVPFGNIWEAVGGSLAWVWARPIDH